jgi:hypothetical protein
MARSRWIDGPQGNNLQAIHDPIGNVRISLQHLDPPKFFRVGAQKRATAANDRSCGLGLPISGRGKHGRLGNGTDDVD